MNRNYSRTYNRSNLRIFSGSSHQTLAKSVAKKCGVSLGNLDLKKFANNETNIDLKENVRGQVKIKKILKNCIDILPIKIGDIQRNYIFKTLFCSFDTAIPREPKSLMF